MLLMIDQPQVGLTTSHPGPQTRANAGDWGSDVGLAKGCRRHNLPRPPRGYWARLAAGMAFPKPVLPPAKIDTVEFDAARHRMPTPPKIDVDLASIKVAVAFAGEDLAGIAAATCERLSNTAFN